jgi:hypothetical protein
MTNFSLPAPLDRILEEARLKAVIAQSYLTALKSFGISQDWLDQIQTDINAIADIPTFDLQKTQLKQLTSAKDVKLNECKEWGRQLKLRMTLATTDKKLKGVEFPSKTWIDCQQNESKLIAFFPTLIELAKNHASVLETMGQTKDDVQQGQKLLQELIETNQSQEEFNIKRKGITVDRQLVYRRLYDGVNRINRVGQMVFKDNAAVNVLFRSSWSQGSSTETPNPTPDTTLKTLENS